jgi:hypothetical protein
MTDNSPDTGLIEVIRADGVADAAAELAEAGLDQLMQDGFLRDVPLLGTVLGTFRAFRSIRDLMLAKKLGRFIRGLQAVPQEQRESFCESLTSPEERRRVGETLILILDRLDDMAKPALTAKTFNAYMRGEIEWSKFRLLATAIDRLDMSDLEAVKAFYSEDPTATKPSHEDCQAFALAGLATITAQGDGGGMFDPMMAGANIVYRPNELGTLFMAVVLGDN